MNPNRDGLLLLTGATGLVGSHVAEAAVAAGYRVRALVRRPERAAWLAALGVELAPGDLGDAASLRRAAAGARWLVHAAAKVGDWGPLGDYWRTNVDQLGDLLAVARAGATLERFVHVSSLGVYEPRDHHGTDELVAPCPRGRDPYPRTKIEAERLVLAAARDGLAAVVLRPGFVYGARDRLVLPSLVEALRRGTVRYVGDGEQRLDCTYAKNFAHAVLLALAAPGVVGEVINVTDDPVVSRREYIGTVARLAGVPEPTESVPRPVVKAVAYTLDPLCRLVGTPSPPLLSKTRYKFLALNLEFSIAKAKRLLGYAPPYGFQAGMADAVAWLRAAGAA